MGLRTCDPETPVDWHRVAACHTPVKMLGIVNKNPLSFPVYQHTWENNFGFALGDIVPYLAGERD